MKTNEDYISPSFIEVRLEQESAICAASPKEGGFDDYEYEVLPEIF